MQCPVCRSTQSKVLETRTDNKQTRRRRVCAACGFRYSTSEAVVARERRR